MQDPLIVWPIPGATVCGAWGCVCGIDESSPVPRACGAVYAPPGDADTPAPETCAFAEAHTPTINAPNKIALILSP